MIPVDGFFETHSAKKNGKDFNVPFYFQRKNEGMINLAGIFFHTLKSGATICVEIFSSEIEFEGRAVRLVLANDITEKQEYIDTIEIQNKKLRIIAWTQSHVLRSPLSRILGIINLLDMEPKDSEDVPFLLEQIKVSSNELDKIIRKIVSETNSIGI